MVGTGAQARSYPIRKNDCDGVSAKLNIELQKGHSCGRISISRENGVFVKILFFVCLAVLVTSTSSNAQECIDYWDWPVPTFSTTSPIRMRLRSTAQGPPRVPVAGSPKSCEAAPDCNTFATSRSTPLPPAECKRSPRSTAHP